MNRKAFAYILVVIIVIPITYALTFSLRDIWIKHAMLEALEAESLQVIHTNVSLVKWVEEDEVNIDGKYFDVKSFYISGQIIELKGLYDEKEDELALQIEKYHNNKSSKTCSGQIQVLALLFQPLIINDSFFERNEILKKNFTSFCIISEDTLQGQKYLDTPPPKILA